MVLLQRRAQNWGKLNSQGPLDLLLSLKSVFGESGERKLCLEASSY